MRPTRLILNSLFMAALSGAIACGSKGSDGGGTGPGPTPTIALALGSSAATVVQGGNTVVAATLTRGGGYTGNVDLTVEGAPAGVTAAVSNVQTSGTQTTANVTVTVAASVAAQVYNLTVRGTGSGVSSTTAPFALTVSQAPDYQLSVAPATATVTQGASSPAIAVTIARTNFPDPVTLTLGGTVPAGVTATFTPPSTAGNSSSMTIAVGAATPPGVYNLSVNGTGTPGARSTPFTLTVNAAGSFTLGITPAGGVTIAQGAPDNTMSVTINRTNYPAGITLTAENVPAGLTVSFAPNPATLNSSVITLTPSAGLTPNTYTITIRGTGPASLRAGGSSAALEATTTLDVTVVTPGNFSIALNLACSTGFNLEQNAIDDDRVIAITRTSFPSAITFAVDNLPAGMTASFSPSPTTGNSTRLTLDAGSTAPGTYDLVLRGTGPGATQTLPLKVLVSAGPAPTPNVLTYQFDTGTREGWAPGQSCTWLTLPDWGNVVFQESMLVLDGVGPAGNVGIPNAWISKLITIPANATYLQWDASGHFVNGAGSRLQVRILDNGVSTYPFAQAINGSAPVRVFNTYSANVWPWAGKTVRIFFEQDDNGFSGTFPGAAEQIWIDNIRVLSSLPAAWTLRRQVTLTAGSSAVPAGYSASVVFDHAALVGAGKSLASGDDIRMVRWDGVKYHEIDRVLDAGSSWNSATTKIFFKTEVPIAANASDVTYYLYYGNAGAGAPPDNRARVYLFHDTFELNNLSKWTKAVPSLWAPSGAQVHAGSVAGSYPTEAPGARNLLASANALNESDVLLESWWYLSSASTAFKVSQGVRSGGNSNFSYNVGIGGGTTFGWSIDKVINTAFTNLVNVPATPPVNTWFRVGAAIQGTTLRMFVDGTQVAIATGLTELTAGNIQLGKFEIPAGAGWWVDDVVARKYVNPEPGGALGSEQSGPFPVAVAWLRP